MVPLVTQLPVCMDPLLLPSAKSAPFGEPMRIWIAVAPGAFQVMVVWPAMDPDARAIGFGLAVKEAMA